METKKNQIKTTGGTVILTEENGIFHARHIRYAKSERFQKPVPVKKSDGEIILPEKTPVCPQNLSPLLEKMIGKTNLDDFEAEESTQFLSVYAPEKIQVKQKLPVIVWFHGGSYEIGCGDISTADPKIWVREQDVIMVTVSYRLGIFGFLGGSKDKPANLGLFDMIEALRWINRNIENFGGDKKNITLFGQSSGGDAVAHLMIADGAENLFQRAIIQSAPLGLRKNRKKMTAEFLKNMSHFTADSDAYEMIENYREYNPSFLKYGLKAMMPFGSQYGFPPLCREDEAEKKWQKAARKIDVLIGMNDEETALYLKSSDKKSGYFTKKLINRTVRSTTEKIYGKSAREFAENLAASGGNVYLYRIYSGLKHNPFAAAHAFDLPLIFGNRTAWENAGILKNIPWDYLEENGRKIRTLWTAFAQSGIIPEESPKPDILKIRKL